MELTRKQIIDNLSYIADSIPDDACGEWRDSLAYAISSLKTDEAYQIMYEGGEIYTKADMLEMLTDIQLEIEELNTPPVYQDEDYFLIGTNRCSELIQQKINKLEENKNG